MEDDSLVIEIGGVYVSEDVLQVFFNCDLPKCHGVCCATENASIGAPLTETEVENLTNKAKQIATKIPKSQATNVTKNGIFEKSDVRYFTPTLPDSAQCAFAVQEKCCWHCAIQKHEDELEMKKPISCSLFPVRELMTDDFKPLLVLEYWDECAPAYDNGEKNDIVVYEALKGALIERFGETFYNTLDDFVQNGGLENLQNQ